MRNPVSDPFSLGGDTGPSADEVAAAAPFAIDGRDNALTLLQAFLQRDVEIADLTRSTAPGIEIEASMSGRFILLESSLQTGAGDVASCALLVDRDEAAAALEFDAEADLSAPPDAAQRIQSVADSLIEILNTHLAAHDVSFGPTAMSGVALPADAAKLLLPADDTLLRVDFTFVLDAARVSATVIVGSDAVRMLGGNPVSGAAMPRAQAGRVPTGPLDSPADPFSAQSPRSRSGGQTMMSDMPGASASSVRDGADIRPVQFQQFVETADGEAGSNLDLILDVNLKISVQLGKTIMTLKEVLDLGPGFVIELDKLAGEPVDILVNEKPIARGEVVVVDENFGVRVVDIISPARRVASLR